jgi:extracellular elastinolytic metalloproteinase
MTLKHPPGRWRLALKACSRAVLLMTFGAAMLAAPGIAFASEGHAGLADLDARSGKVAPSSSQLSTVESLGARATWNDFGTPKTLLKDGGWLATGVSGSSADAAARNWIASQKALFRLSDLSSLKLESDYGAEGNAWAVTYRQHFGGLAARQDGVLTVGLVGTPSSSWKIGYVSSKVTGSTGLAAQPSISAGMAWAKAAANAGIAVSVLGLRPLKDDREWKQFAVPGFAQVQRARLVALPTPLNGVRPAWEALVVNSDGGLALGYRTYVDAVTGDVLVRANTLHNSHPNADTFTGSYVLTDGACGTFHGPWDITSGEQVESIVVTATANLVANDIVIELYFDADFGGGGGRVLVQAQDLLTSPEVMNYDPPGFVPEGRYEVRICDFVDGSGALVNASYSGSIVFNTVATSGGGGPLPPYVARWDTWANSPLLGALSQDPWNIPDPPLTGSQADSRQANDIRRRMCWDATGPAPTFTPIPGCETVATGKPDLQNLASRVPWDVIPPSTPTFTTAGNNAITREAWLSPLTPGGAFQPFGAPPFSNVRDYSYRWTNQWEREDCNPATTFTSAQRNDIDPAVVSLFTMHNRMHDWQYFLGFTEENWNGQLSNFGTTSTGMEGDPLIGDAQAGAVDGGAPSYLGRDNANMITNPDGVPSVTNQYLWQPLAGAFYAPCVDGDKDMGVAGHEFGHMTENRMIGKGQGRNGHHAGAMGESFGDFNATEYLNEYGYATVVAGQNPFALGAYATGDKIQGIRNYPGNFLPTGAFPTAGVNPMINPLQFGNMGYDLTGGQVHADGEIWTKVNFQIRQALVNKYNASFPETNQTLQVECADGVHPANLCPGNRRWIRLYFFAMLLMSDTPTMLEARDAVLMADQMLFGSANQSDLWLQYARYGFGQFAFSTAALVNSDTDPAPDHMSPLHNEATVNFTSPAPNARVYVGHYEARTSPIADTDPTTNNGAVLADGNNLDQRAKFVPGTYEFVANARGFGNIRFRLTLTAGQTLTFNLPFVTNWASSAPGVGATATTVAPAVWTNLGDLIDDTEATNADYGPNQPEVNLANPSIIVNLGGTTPRVVRQVNVSAMLLSQNRFTALRSFQILTCNGSDAVCAVPANFTARSIVGNGNVNAFPGTAPRPVAPEIILRNFVLTSSVNATHVMIKVLHNQCTGNLAFQGEQDADPLNVTDCTTGSPGTLPGGILGTDAVLLERDDEVHIAELQVFSTTSGGGNGGGGNGGGNGGGGDDGECDGDDDIVKLGPAVAKPGSTITYTITFTNLGDTDDDDCEIDDLLGDDLTYVSSTGGGTYDAATRTVTWKTGPVASGTSRTFTVDAKVSDDAAAGSVLMNQAYLGRLGLDLSPLATATTMVLP